MKSNLKVSLVFAGESVNPENITEVLGVSPDQSAIAAEEVPVGVWSYRSPLSGSESNKEVFAFWRQFISENETALQMLKDMNYEPYFEVLIAQTESSEAIDFFIDPDFMKAAASCSAAMSIAIIPQMTANEILDFPFTLVIPKPKKYFSKGDKENFFRGLASIKSVKNIGDSNEAVMLHLNEKLLDDESLRELLAIMSRYNLDLSVLSSQCTEVNKSWFKNERKYWYSNVFGSD